MPSPFGTGALAALAALLLASPAAAAPKPPAVPAPAIEAAPTDTAAIVAALLDTLRVLETENAARLQKVLDYVVDSTTAEQFVNDGWNPRDPLTGRLGVIGILYGELPPPFQTVDVVLGFTYARRQGGGSGGSDPMLSFRHAAIESGLRMLKSPHSGTRTSVVPMRTPKGRKPITERQWRLERDKIALEPFFEDTAVVQFRGGVLKRVDVSGLRRVDVAAVLAARTLTCRCRLDGDWLEREARSEKGASRPTPEDVRSHFAAGGLDTVSLRYRLPNALEPDGWAEAAGTRLRFLVYEAGVGRLIRPADDRGSVKGGWLLKGGRRFRLEVEGGPGGVASLEYDCERAD